MRVYADHAATTPVFPEVIEEMLPYWNQQFGNPSSLHSCGRKSRNAIDNAYERLANSLGAPVDQLNFTGGGTSAIWQAILGVMLSLPPKKNHLITSSIEHKAVLDACRWLEQNKGVKVTYLSVDHFGVVDLDQYKAAFTDSTALVSIMHGNNETGTLQPIYEIGKIAREAGVLFHTDMIQTLGQEKIDLANMPVDLASFASHKINGPKGAGAFYVAKGVSYLHSALSAFTAGTENVAAIVGFGRALELTVERRSEHLNLMRHLRKTMIDGLKKEEISFDINGFEEYNKCNLAHIINISFPDRDADELLVNYDLEGISCSSGAACSAGLFETSHVLQAMALSAKRIKSAIRFSFGYNNTDEDIRYILEKSIKILRC